MSIVASAVVPRFGTTVTLGFLLLDVTPILLIALPMTLVIITGEIDLSVASMVGLSSVIFGVMHQSGLSIPTAALVALVVGAIGGTINGLLATAVGLPSLAVTIGTLALFRGLAVGILGTTAITDFPRYWTQLAKVQDGGHRDSDRDDPGSDPGRDLRGCAALHSVRPGNLCHRPQCRSCVSSPASE